MSHNLILCPKNLAIVGYFFFSHFGYTFSSELRTFYAKVWTMHNKKTWHVFEMTIDDDHLNSVKNRMHCEKSNSDDVTMGRVADAARKVQSLPKRNQ